VDYDRNFVAWMIAGGRPPVDPSVARNLAHRRALAETTQDTDRGPGLIGRLAAAALAGVRPAPVPIAATCCPA
jgi:hypothetical protein